MSKRSHLYGNLPLLLSGINKGRLDRPAIAKQFGFAHYEIVKAYNNWILIFRYPESDLTFEQYLNKLVEAGISPIKVGNSSLDYSLSRIGDLGPYTKESCRFLTTHENCLEQKHIIAPYIHGTVRCYKRGHCRCVGCRKANSEYSKEYSKNYKQRKRLSK